MPVTLTAMDAKNAARIHRYLEENRKDVEAALAALERWDSVDFEAVLEKDKNTAALVLQLFLHALPDVHWFYLYEAMYKTMVKELGLTNPKNGLVAKRAKSRAFAAQAGHR